MSKDDPPNIVIVSDVASDGTFIVSIEAGSDVVFTLDRDAAWRYANMVLTAVGYANYDAAVVKQLLTIPGIDQTHAAACLVDLRKGRPELASEFPLSFAAGVARRDHRPFLTGFVNGKALGQWEIDAARDHARWALEAVIAVDLDAAYLRMLTGMDFERDMAYAVVSDLKEYRHE